MSASQPLTGDERAASAKVRQLDVMLGDLLLAYMRADDETKAGFQDTLKSCGISINEAGASLSAGMRSAFPRPEGVSVSASQPLTGDELAEIKERHQAALEALCSDDEHTVRGWCAGYRFLDLDARNLVAEVERLRADLANVASCLHRDVLAAALGEIPK